MEDLAACSSLRIFVGCWFDHDGSKSYGIWRLAKTSGFWLATGCGTVFWPMKNQEIGNSTRNFDGRWLSRNRRGQRKVRSVGASSVWYGGFVYGKCVFLNFLLLRKMLEAWYRCPQLGCLHEHSRFQCGALLLVWRCQVDGDSSTGFDLKSRAAFWCYFHVTQLSTRTQKEKYRFAIWIIKEAIDWNWDQQFIFCS